MINHISEDGRVFRRKEDLRQHVYDRPDPYIGAVSHHKRTASVLRDDMKFDTTETTLPSCLEKLFFEPICNAGDNVIRSREKNLRPGLISVILRKNGWITVENCGGLSVPLERVVSGEWLPQIIFGDVMSSSNYDDTEARLTSGRNGLGIKLVNIFSKRFVLTIVNGGTQYKQIWSDNMKQRAEPKIVQLEGGGHNDFVRVSFLLDFDYFKVGKSFIEDASPIFAYHTLNIIAFAVQTPVLFSSPNLKFETSGISISQYVAIIAPGQQNIVVSEDVDGGHIDYAVIDTPSVGKIVSFVNTAYTGSGGNHVVAVREAAVRPIVAHFSKKWGIKFKITSFMSNLTLVIRLAFCNPTFDDQSKTAFSNSIVCDTLSGARVSVVDNWKLASVIKEKAEKNKATKLSKLNRELTVKSGRRVRIEGAIDANLAGTKSAKDCILVLVEGNSASKYASHFSKLMNGRDRFGIVPLKGKIINVIKSAANDELVDNKEFQTIVGFLGAKIGRDYTKSIAGLRYGKVYIMADADVDGHHIVGLLLAMFRHYYPTLLEIGYVSIMRTPIIRASLGKQRRSFMSLEEFRQWKETVHNLERWNINYCKGLASSDDEDIAHDINSTMLCPTFIADEDYKRYIDLAFDEDTKVERRQWIREHETVDHSYIRDPELPISIYINNELIEFSKHSIIRALPMYTDGLKPCQRKCIYTALTAYSNYTYGNSNKPIPVITFGSKVQETVSYNHGPDSLYGTISKMAQTMQGTNNLEYFLPKGQFGHREDITDKFAAPRYLKVVPRAWLRYIFRREDAPLYKRIEEDGELIEPETLFPTIPMILVNGAHGIGTGWTTGFLNHHPLQIIEWIKRHLRGKTPQRPPNVWYRGYGGFIEQREASVEIGGYMEDRGDVVVIRELRIGKLIKDYEQFLQSLVESGKLEDFTSNGNGDNPVFELYGLDESMKNLKSLELRTVYKFGNMYARFPGEIVPKRFSSVCDYLILYCRWRLKVYRERKAYTLKKLGEDLDKLKMKARFILAYVNGEFEVKGVKRSELNNTLKQLGIDDNSLLDTTPMSAMTLENVEKLKTKIEKMESEMSEYAVTSTRAIWIRELDELEAKISDHL